MHRTPSGRTRSARAPTAGAATGRLDRGARLAERLGLSGDVPGWRADAQRIQAAIIELGWDPEDVVHRASRPGWLEAGLLALPLRRAVEARHPRMIATVESIVRRLGADEGLLYRYLPEESADGLRGHEGAIPLCSFLAVGQSGRPGTLDEAMALYESLCGSAGTLGLLPEEIARRLAGSSPTTPKR